MSPLQQDCIVYVSYSQFSGGEVYKSLSHILTDFKKRLAIPYGKGKQNECQYPFPDKMS